jgi:hypothetical protein
MGVGVRERLVHGAAREVHDVARLEPERVGRLSKLLVPKLGGFVAGGARRRVGPVVELPRL